MTKKEIKEGLIVQYEGERIKERLYIIEILENGYVELMLLQSDTRFGCGIALSYHVDSIFWKKCKKIK